MDARSAERAEEYVPVIDLGRTEPPDPARRLERARAIGRACEISGFLTVVGHGVPERLVADLREAAREFFAQPAATKNAVRADPLDPLQRGYSAHHATERFNATRINEPLLAGSVPAALPELLLAPNRWPDAPAFRTAFVAYYRALEELTREIYRLLALALDLPPEWFDDKIDNHMSPMAINYYAPQTAPGTPGALRAQPHVDFGTLTLLYQEDAPGGLQVRDRRGDWLDVPARPGSFVVNLGNLMTLWTNNRWASTVHRVVNPPDDQLHLDRVSIPFFHQPNPGAVIECIPTCTGPDDPPRHAPITSAEYFVARSRRIFVERSLRERHGLPGVSPDVVTR